jgi:hypothetical protein
VLGGCGLVVVVTLIEREWRVYLSHLAAIIYIPTALGFSNADWLAGLGFPTSFSVLKSDLPDLVCLIIGLAVVSGFFLGRGANRLEGVRDTLLGQGADVEETDRAMGQAFQGMLVTVTAAVAALTAMWAVATLASEQGLSFLDWTGGGVALVGLGCVVLLIILFVHLARRETVTRSEAASVDDENTAPLKSGEVGGGEHEVEGT